MIEKKICDPLTKILLFLDLYFERYACLKIMSQPMSRLMAHEMTVTLKFLAGTDLAIPVSRPMSQPSRHESTHESTSAGLFASFTEPWILFTFVTIFHRGRPMSRPPGMSRLMSRPL